MRKSILFTALILAFSSHASLYSVKSRVGANDCEKLDKDATLHMGIMMQSRTADMDGKMTLHYRFVKDGEIGEEYTSTEVTTNGRGQAVFRLTQELNEPQTEMQFYIETELGRHKRYHRGHNITRSRAERLAHPEPTIRNFPIDAGYLPGFDQGFMQITLPETKCLEKDDSFVSHRITVTQE